MASPSVGGQLNPGKNQYVTDFKALTSVPTFWHGLCSIFGVEVTRDGTRVNLEIPALPQSPSNDLKTQG
ncbi:MAG: hypothetical protein AMXMBFR84_43960 [Candidatus Hydrogenedentota bacterium]